MLVSRALRFRLCLCLAGLTLLAASPPAHAESRTPQAASAVDVATLWLYALKRGDTRVLDRSSVYPFELRIAKAPCSCKGGKARDSTQLAELLGDLMKTEDVQALEITSADAKEVAKGSLPSWAKRWTQRLPKGARLVHVQSSSATAYKITYVLVIKDDQVHSVWLDAAPAA